MMFRRLTLLTGAVALVFAVASSVGAAAAGPSPRRLVANCWKASWAPDSRRFVCGRFPEETEIDLVDAQSGSRTPLVPSGKDPSWSPDGKVVAYVVTAPPGGGEHEEVWVVPAAGGEPRRIAPGGFPQFAADGRLYFQQRVEARLVSVGLDHPEEVTVVLAPCPFLYPAISHDGRQIIVAEGDALRIVGAGRWAKFSWPTPGIDGFLAGWSPDGKLPTFGGRNDTPIGLWVVDPARARATQIAAGHASMPAWSPDGKQLAFDLREGDRREVWAVDRAYVEARLRTASMPPPPSLAK